MRRLDARALGIDAVVAALSRPPADVDPAIQRAVDDILAAVRARGDSALLELTAELDGFRAASAAALVIPPADFDAAWRAIDAATRDALMYAAERIERYHATALPKSWRLTDEHGSVLGQDVRPLDRVGVYIPGGRAAYPSTVLMTAIPARVAGVREIVLVTPPAADGGVAPAVLAAAHAAGVTEGWRLGGAQAIAALAYGTPTIKRVDKIVGPGNVYVAVAKSRVFGDVGIDMVAGPSEVLVVADGDADPEWAAADLLAQAEHDPMARAVLVSDSDDLLVRVAAAVERQLAALPRRTIAAEALDAHGALVRVASLDD
ncbi:MAG: histidinol dehydrogenase, partial [Candidatus Rokubacteria bacterium]|nr:histidinol dehydrogenase [Candidatus Rokubacteria bacterium]